MVFTEDNGLPKVIRIFLLHDPFHGDKRYWMKKSRNEHREQVPRSQWSNGRSLTVGISQENLDFVLPQYPFEVLGSRILSVSFPKQ